MVKQTKICVFGCVTRMHGVGAAQVQGPSFLNGPRMTRRTDSTWPRRRLRARPRNKCRSCFRQIAERFHLSFHGGSKDLNIYALEVAKGGLKMKESLQGATGEPRWTRTQVGNPDFVAGRAGSSIAVVRNGMTSADIARQVQTLAPAYFSDGPVVDLSGLKGRYDFKLKWISIL